MTTIPASTIVNVTPSVLGAGGSALNVIGLMLTTSIRVPIGTVQSFANPLAVTNFFGSGSTEATMASIYFLGNDNSLVKPGALLFAQYPSSAVGAYIRGGNISQLALASLQAINATLTISIDGGSYSGTVNLSAATSFSAAATTIQTALNASLPTLASFTATIASTTMTVSAMTSGAIMPGQTITGTGVTASSVVVSQLTGTAGQAGTYTLSQSSTVGSGTAMLGKASVVVAYDSVSGAYTITSGDTGALSTVAFATGAAATSLLLTSATGAVLSQGANAATPIAFMNSILQITQNWVTFTTLFNPDNSGFANKLLFSQWTNSQSNDYAYIAWDTDASPTTTAPATASFGYAVAQAAYSGTALVYSPDASFACFIMGTAASISFSSLNGRQNFFGRSQAGLVPTVTTSVAQTNLLANGYNFYGAYANAANNFQFLAPGSVSGTFKWLDSYINQIWLNNSLQNALMNMLIQNGSIPYNQAGTSLIDAACLDPINAAVNFGAIRAGVSLSASQASSVNAAANNTNAAVTLSQRGWYLQILPTTAAVRAARGSPPCTFWYMDGESVQSISLSSIILQ